MAQPQKPAYENSEFIIHERKISIKLKKNRDRLA